MKGGRRRQERGIIDIGAEERASGGSERRLGGEEGVGCGCGRGGGGGGEGRVAGCGGRRAVVVHFAVVEGEVGGGDGGGGHEGASGGAAFVGTEKVGVGVARVAKGARRVHDAQTNQRQVQKQLENTKSPISVHLKGVKQGRERLTNERGVRRGLTEPSCVETGGDDDGQTTKATTAGQYKYKYKYGQSDRVCTDQKPRPTNRLDACPSHPRTSRARLPHSMANRPSHSATAVSPCSAPHPLPVFPLTQPTNAHLT